MFIELLLICIAIILGELINIYITYGNIFKKNKSSLSLYTAISSNLKLRLLKLSLSTGGAVVPYGNAVPNNNNNNNNDFDGATTEVELNDADLNELLQIVFAEIGNSNIISVELLQSLGLYTNTVVSALEALGYIIF
jgi:hypothetical protein